MLISAENDTADEREHTNGLVAGAISILADQSRALLCLSDLNFVTHSKSFINGSRYRLVQTSRTRGRRTKIIVDSVELLLPANQDFNVAGISRAGSDLAIESA